MKRYLSIALLALFVLTLFVACSEKEALKINAPQEMLTAELGSYDLPKYQVVNEENLIKADYEVVVKKAVDPNGKELTVAYNKINATVTGIYTITYGVVEGDVADVEIKISFADHIAPTLNLNEDLIPKYYIQGMKYSLPAYSLSGDPDYDACWMKVYYLTDRDAQKQEVAVADNQFEVTHNTGFYQIVIHAEDAAGNSEDYTYTVEATGPSEIVDGKILYFDEKFGVSQVKTLWNLFDLSYSSEVAYEDEAGSMKVVTSSATDYIVLDKLVQSDISDYDFLVFRIYNANDYDVMSGYTWFGDITLKAREWTEFKVPVAWFEVQNATTADTGKRIYSDDITGLAIRLFEDYDSNACEAGSTFYFSAMYAVKAGEGGSTAAENVVVQFEEPLDLNSVALYWTSCHTLSIDNTVKFGDEAGSLKITYNQEQGWNYLQILFPHLKDISEYDYITFNIYNPTDNAWEICYCWGGNVMIQPNSWTEVKWAVSLFANGDVDNVTDKDISGFEICFYGDGMVGGDCFYMSAITAGKYEAQDVADNVAHKFDSEADLGRVNLYWSDPHSISIDNTVKFGDEAGSLKVEVKIPQSNYIILNNPYNFDFSDYDYITFWVYSESEVEFEMGTAWAADTVIKPGVWTQVKITKAMFEAGSVTPDEGDALTMANITNLRIRIMSADNMSVGDCFYISSITAGKNAPVDENVADDLAAKFEMETDLENVRLYWTDPHALSIDTTVVHGEDKGSLKVTALVDGQGSNYIILTTPLNNGDFSEYDYISFWVYNPTEKEFAMGTAWAADTVCKPGEWTEVRITKAMFEAGSVTPDEGDALTMGNIAELRIRLMDAENLVTGDCFYISSITAEKNETVSDNLAAKFETEQDLGNVRLYWTDPHALSIDTTVVHGEDKGSLKVTALVDGQGSNYIILTTPLNNGDFSEYDYISFWVYNPTEKEFGMGTAWAADTVCKPGEWTEVRITKAMFEAGSVTPDEGDALTMGNIAELRIRLMDAENLVTGDCFYISSITAEKNAPVADVAENLAAKFENEEDLGNVRLYWTDPHALSIDTTVVHGEDKGSLKVTALVDGQGSNYIILTTPLNNGDFSEYDYISFWVYNPTEKEFGMGTAWAADTVCKPGEWTEVRITKAMFEAGSVTPDEGDALTMGNIAELRIRLMDAENLVTGDCFYISSITAGKNA